MVKYQLLLALQKTVAVVAVLVFLKMVYTHRIVVYFAFKQRKVDQV